MANKSIAKMLAAAFKSITIPDLGSSVLVPEQADRFLRIVEERTVMLGAVRRVNMMAGTRNIDRTGFSSRILRAAQAEGTEFTFRDEPDFFTNQLIAVKGRGASFISDEALEENIERDNFENTLVDMIASQAGQDLEELFLAGDTASADTFLALTDGWLKVAANSVTGVANADFTATDVEDMFEAMILAVDPKYLSSRGRWRFYVTFDMENDYRDVLRARGTALGDQAQTSAMPLNYKGFLVEEEPKMPAGRALFTNVDNTVYGIRRDIEIEPERKPGFDRWDFHVRVRGDAHYEDENAAVSATGYTGPA